MIHYATRSAGLLLIGALLSGALLLGCPAGEPGPSEGSGESAGPAAGSGDEATGEQGPADEAASPAAHAIGPDAVCPFVDADIPAGSVACPEGCVMVRAAPVDETLGCARTGATFEVAIACLRLPAEIQPGGACYRNTQGHSVVTAYNYPAVLHAGWTRCPDDYAFRQVAPCPMGGGSANEPIPAPDGSAPPAPPRPPQSNP